MATSRSAAWACGCGVDGDRWVRTFKAGGAAAGGLHTRDEWEEGVAGPVLDLAALRDTPLADIPDANTLHQRLVEAFRVQMERTTWEVKVHGARLEVALDLGEVRRGELAAPVAEVEIELLEGEPDAAFAFALELARRVPMRPSTVSKAARGYRLVSGRALEPVKAGDLVLEAGATPPESARQALRAGLGQMMANEEGVLESDDPEFVHQMRVGLRRMRSALRAHRKALEPGFEASVRKDLGWITDKAGIVRDLDVLSGETLVAMARDGAEADADFEARLERRRRDARTRLRDAIGSSRHARLVLTLARWLASPPGHAPRARKDLFRFAAKVVKKHHQTLLEGGRAFADLGAAERHEVRIAAKRLRYVSEGFASLFAKGTAERYLARLSDLQDDLGEANDAAVAMGLIESLDPPPALAHFARGWLAAKTEAALRAVPGHFEALRGTPDFWKA